MHRRHRAPILALAALALSALAAECTTTRGPARTAPVLENRYGEVDADVLDTLIERTEQARGLDFVRDPSLDLVEPEAPQLTELRGAAPVALVRPAGLLATQPLANTAVDLARDRIVAARPVDGVELRVALGFLLDAQHYPHLIETAESAPGDVGVALRALLAGSALATANGGLGPASAEAPVDPLAGKRIEAAPPESAGLLGDEPVLAAQGFLRSQGDRETAFRAPPISTEQLLRPALWKAGNRPLWLEGDLPAPNGCRVTRDASVGVYGLFRALVTRSVSAPALALAAWRGDRLVTWHCENDVVPWLFVVDLDDEAGARAFASVASKWMPSDLPDPSGSLRRGRRVVVWHDLPRERAEAAARDLLAVELRSADDAVAFGARAGKGE